MTGLIVIWVTEGDTVKGTGRRGEGKRAERGGVLPYGVN